jgi:hypothetical protein
MYLGGDFFEELIISSAKGMKILVLPLFNFHFKKLEQSLVGMNACH